MYEVTLLVLYVTVICLYLQAGQGRTMSTKCGKVHLTVSSLKGSQIELNWKTNCTQESGPTAIALYDRDIGDSEKPLRPLVKINAIKYPQGYFKTNITFNYTNLPGQWDMNSTQPPQPGPNSFPYWIVSFFNDKILDKQSLAIQPTWMADNSVQLGPKQIGSLLIPGTHNSACYQEIQALVDPYVLTQDRSIWTQLIFGIRYFDFRVAYYKKTGFYINHDVVKVIKIEIVFDQIRRFLEKSPKEIIFIDFHRFPYPLNWDADLHLKFVELLKQELANYAYPRCEFCNPKGPFLNEIWAKRKNLIITYADRLTSGSQKWLWPPLPQIWADTTDVKKLKTYMDDYLEKKATQHVMFDALMTELTPTPLDVLFRRNHLRQLASNVNSNLTKWVAKEWAGKCNIIASDFFLGNNLINVAINVNTQN